MTKVGMPSDPNWKPLCYGKDCDPYAVACGGCGFYYSCAEVAFQDIIAQRKKRADELKEKADAIIKQARKEMNEKVDKATKRTLELLKG